MKGKEKTKQKEKIVVGTEEATKECVDRDCPTHGHLKTRGKTFEGTIIKKFKKRIVIEFQRMVYVPKYERYAVSRTRIHARVPVCMEDQIKIGDLVKVQECRPLSKIIHFVIIKKIKDAEDIQ